MQSRAISMHAFETAQSTSVMGALRFCGVACQRAVWVGGCRQELEPPFPSWNPLSGYSKRTLNIRLNVSHHTMVIQW